MKRLPVPLFDPEITYSICVSSIKNTKMRERMQAISPHIGRQGEYFAAHALSGVTYAITSFNTRRGEDAVVVGGVTKEELVNLYKRNMVSNELGRAIYDAILVGSANCPSCGDIGAARTLDHYLPKANFPALSVCPYNLIPSCRDCNRDKGNPVPKSAFEQLLNPYFDDECFFNETWVSATIDWAPSFEIRFRATPPSHWGRLDRERAIHHFSFFKIANGYRRKAAEELPVIEDQRRTLSLGSHDFKKHLLAVAHSAHLFPNHWRKALYLCLANDTRFCTYGLNG